MNTYKHPQFLEDVRNLVVAHDDALTPFEQAYLKQVPITFYCEPDTLTQIEAMMVAKGMPSLMRAQTKELQAFLGVPNLVIEIYATGEPNTASKLAYELVHELGHVLAIIRNQDDGHGPKWAMCANELGIRASTYKGEVGAGGCDITWDQWVNNELHHRIQALPAMTDREAVSADMLDIGYTQAPGLGA